MEKTTRKVAVEALAHAALAAAAVLALAACGREEGAANAGTDAAAERHLLKIDTADKGYLKFPVHILSRSTQEALTFDPRRGKPATISYRLTRDGDIRVRVCWRQGKSPVLRTLLDWTRQEFGGHELEWDGRDASGNIVDNTRCLIDIEGDSPLHKKHDRARCRDLDLRVLEPRGPDAVIGRLSEIRLRLASDPALAADGYELRTYVDYALVATTKLGGDTGGTGDAEAFALPDVDGLAEGPHLITVNLDDRHDHIGAAGIRVDVRR